MNLPGLVSGVCHLQNLHASIDARHCALHSFSGLFQPIIRDPDCDDEVLEKKLLVFFLRVELKLN
jgi:hypothetical protein